MVNHIKTWNRWRKHNLNSKMYKILVLFKIINSPTLKYTNITWGENDENK